MTDSGVWIGPQEAATAAPGRRPAFWLRAEFDVAGVGPQALLTFSARGLVEIFINGERIGDELLPGYMQYNARLPLRSYDVTEFVRPGANALAILLRDGWFRGQIGAGRAADQWGTATTVWAQLDVDGVTVAATDGSWHTAASHVTSADLIAGQSEDRRLFDPQISQPGFAPVGWSPALVVDAPSVPLVPHDAPPVRRVAELMPIAVTEPSAGVFVADLGQNINGWCRLSNLGPAGTTVTLTHGKWLDADGDLTMVNLVVNFPMFPEPLAPGQVDTVISAGVEGDVFEPRMTTHGFRYVRVEGHPGPLLPADITGIVVHSDLVRTGWFECENDRINRLHDAAVWSMRGNVCEIPTDCPQRERSGWTGDWEVFAPTAAFLYDVDSFARKWMADVRLDQRADGAIANISPACPAEGFAGPTDFLQASSGWGDVIVLAPWAMYEAYGDPAVLAESWEAMQRWVGYAADRASAGRSDARVAASAVPAPHEQYLWDTGFHWGEWLEPNVDLSDFGAFVRADKSEVATAYLHRSASTIARIATVLSQPAEVIRQHQELADGTLDAWRREFVRADGSLLVQTQASRRTRRHRGHDPSARRHHDRRPPRHASLRVLSQKTVVQRQFSHSDGPASGPFDGPGRHCTAT
jgi:alpha-L-rhamnosidase